MQTYPVYKVAAAHVAPMFLDTPATVEKACALIAEAARNGARLIAFPETYVPAFPVWAALRAPIYNHDLFKQLAAGAVRVPGPEVAKISAAAKKAGIFVSIGINEGTAASVGCIWNSNILIGDDGAILNHHRKIVPTYFEKLIWANGDGAGLRVVDTALGRPPVWPTRDPKGGGNYDLAAAIRVRAGAHSFEAKCFTIVASGFMDKAMRDQLAGLDKEAGRILDNSPHGVSMVLAPDALIVGDTISGEEGILYAPIDLEACVEPKQFHDVVGYYNRFDIFKLTVDRSRNRPVTFAAEDVIGEAAATSTAGEGRGRRGSTKLEIAG